MDRLVEQDVKFITLNSFLEELPEYRTIADCCAAIELRDAKKHADEFLLYVGSGEKLKPHELKSLAHALKWQIIYELEKRKALIIPASREKYYKQSGTFLGQEVIDKIDVGKEADEAGNCFALGLYTASVFHSMRIIEWCLRDFGTKAHMSWDNIIGMQWQEIISGIRSKLNAIWPKHKDLNRRPYEDMLGHLETVKNAWRNPVIHLNNTYSEEAAKEIKNAIKAFVRSYVALLPQLEHFSTLLSKTCS